MKVVVLGCGRSGAMLAIQLSSQGHQVTLIERNPEALRRLGRSYPCRVVIGNGLEDEVLVKAGIEEADAFIAVTRGDNTNIMAAQIVQKRYKVAKVGVKVADPLRADAYRKMGLYCLNASALIAGMMRDWMVDEPFKTIDLYNTIPPEMEF
ncbi:MAG: TrkA family potassium uptake protein [Fimbriimonadaceae bacterium]|nr:TrkA family potassium uptake protein [Fimbriimonadaceae bacterium]QYK57231.1 MAG: TrkA family potassium uptake protein [Fimbriimonadaceae bacterium]